jgi:CheY-specific phosphatase CheX
MDNAVTLLPPAFSLMVGHLSEATRDLFAELDLRVSLHPTAAEQAHPESTEAAGMAVIGYAGAGVRGALVMVVEERAIVTWMEAVGVPDGEVADTLGEFSNMLLGRLKERLLPLGISIIATTPTAAIGRGFRLSESPGPSSWASFHGPGWNLRVRLDASFEAGFRVAERPLAWQPKAGDVIDFDAFEARDK